MFVYEIFESIDGEVNYFGQGALSTFIRFAGCNLKCTYCDTEKTQSTEQGQKLSIDDILSRINKNVKKVTLTGGEPFLQEWSSLINLIRRLYYEKNVEFVSIETNGTILFPYIDRDYRDKIGIVMDLKIDCLKDDTFFDIIFRNVLSLVSSTDWIKIPITSRKIYIKASMIVRVIRSFVNVQVAFSPIGIDPKKLLKWMQEDQLYFVVLNVQLHKYLGMG